MNLEEKHIDYLIKKCLSFNDSKYLFISYNYLNINFAKKIILKANELGITDIYLDEENYKKDSELLEKINLNQIEKHDHFNKSIWNKYALLNANFLILNTCNFNLFDLDKEKLEKANEVILKTRYIYEELLKNGEIKVVSALLPNEEWANRVFCNNENQYQRLYQLLLFGCNSFEEELITNCTYQKKYKNN